MAKSKTVFICQECGYESTGWLGKCPACIQWNTFVEERQEAGTHASAWQPVRPKPVSLEEIGAGSEQRIQNEEARPRAGRRPCQGSLMLVGGDPGIGSNTSVADLHYVADRLKYCFSRKSAGDQIGDNKERCCSISVGLNVASVVERKIGLIIMDSANTDTTSYPGSVSPEE